MIRVKAYVIDSFSAREIKLRITRAMQRLNLYEESITMLFQTYCMAFCKHCKITVRSHSEGRPDYMLREDAS